MRGTKLYETSLRIYAKLKTKPQTYTQLKNTMQLQNSTLSICLTNLKNEHLIEKIIVNDLPTYSIIENNPIEQISAFLDHEAKEKYNAGSTYLIIVLHHFLMQTTIQSDSPLPICYHFMDEKIKTKPLSNVLLDWGRRLCSQFLDNSSPVIQQEKPSSKNKLSAVIVQENDLSHPPKPVDYSSLSEDLKKSQSTIKKSKVR